MTVVHMDHSPRVVAAHRVLVLAELQGRSVRQLAALAGIPLATLQRRLTGRSPLDLDELGALAETLDVPITDLLVPRAEREQVGEVAP